MTKQTSTRRVIRMGIDAIKAAALQYGRAQGSAVPADSAPTPAGSDGPAAGKSGAAARPAATPDAGSEATSTYLGSSPQAKSNLSLLATMLGTDPQTLLRQLQSGQGLGAALSGAGVTGYGSSIADSINGGVAVDEYA
jgi:hypothetical protein